MEQFVVSARKYRPQTFNDVVGQKAITSTLLHAIESNHLASALLFTGPRGVGKTTCARILARKINQPGYDDPNEDFAFNVFELDAASNNSVDDIRNLIDQVRIPPQTGKYKVYIIDEVHMLTTEAFNALLKTLEEPPSHAVFILCTTELQKVPATILSRCFRVNFTKATNEELIRSMQRIVKAEEIKIEKEAFIEIAKLADGSFRDGAKILEEVAVFAGKKLVTKNLVNEKYNTLGIGESVFQMIKVFEEKDLKKGFKICRDLENQGMDFKFFIEQLIERLHLILLNKVGVTSLDENSTLSLEDLKKLFELLSDAYSDTKFAVLAQVPLELAILEWSAGKSEVKNLQGPVSDLPPAISATPLVLHTHSGFFEKFMEEVKLNNHLIAGLLRSCKAEEILNGKLTIVASSKFHKERLEEQKTIELLKKSADKISGKKINIEIILKEVKT